MDERRLITRPSVIDTAAFTAARDERTSSHTSSIFHDRRRKCRVPLRDVVVAARAANRAGL